MKQLAGLALLVASALVAETTTSGREELENRDGLLPEEWRRRVATERGEELRLEQPAPTATELPY